MKRMKRSIAFLLLCVGFLHSLPVYSQEATPTLVITEIMYDADGSDTGKEWVEMYNYGASPLSIITGSSQNALRFFDGTNHTLSLVAGTATIPAFGFAIIAADADAWIASHAGFGGTVFDTSMSLKNTSSTVGLVQSGGAAAFTTVLYESSWGGAGNGRTIEVADLGAVSAGRPQAAGVSRWYLVARQVFGRLRRRSTRVMTILMIVRIMPEIITEMMGRMGAVQTAITARRLLTTMVRMDKPVVNSLMGAMARRPVVVMNSQMMVNKVVIPAKAMRAKVRAVRPRTKIAMMIVPANIPPARRAAILRAPVHLVVHHRVAAHHQAVRRQQFRRFLRTLFALTNFYPTRMVRTKLNGLNCITQGPHR